MAIYQVDNTINQIPLKNGYVYCISSIHNIKSILEHGFRTPKKLQTQFAQLINNKPLDEYICFYFNPRNSLLYSRQKTYGDDIIILEIKKDVLLLNNVIFTNKSVKASNFCFADEIKDLLNPNFINWDEVFATSWSDANENVKNEKKFKMMAEVLVPDMVPSAMIAGIVCQNPSVCEKVARILNNNSINISWNSSLFFNVSNDTTANQKREFKYHPQTKDELKALVDDESIYLGDIDTSAITDMSKLFFKGYDENYDNIINERENFDGIEIWNVSNVTDMSYMFSGCKKFNHSLLSWKTSINSLISTNANGSCIFALEDGKYRPQTKEGLKILVEDENVFLGDIDTSAITDMSNLFYVGYDKTERKNFNGISSWNVSNVTNMRGMFYGCENFNQPLNSWDVSNVTDMSDMFYGCENFNQPLNSWNVSNVTNMGGMFENCKNFNQPLNSWNVSNVTSMHFMFGYCKNFNQTLNSWNVSNVTYMSYMFLGCKNFNQPLNSWNVSNVTNMSHMFLGCENFNQPLNSWNVSNVTNMNEMFFSCYNFNQSLNSWNVINVINMNCMFCHCKNYNKPLDLWDVSNVADMGGMFSCCENFNQSLNSWNIKNVKYLRTMFFGCNIDEKKLPNFTELQKKEIKIDAIPF